MKSKLAQRQGLPILFLLVLTILLAGKISVAVADISEGLVAYYPFTEQQKI